MMCGSYCCGGVMVGIEAQVGYVLKCLERSESIPNFELKYKDRSREKFSLVVALVGGGEVSDYRLYALKLSKEGRVLKSEVFELSDFVEEEEIGDLDEGLEELVGRTIRYVGQFWWE